MIQCLSTFDITGLSDMPRKSSKFTERPQMLSHFSKGTVKLILNFRGICPLVIIKLNNLLNTVAIAGWLY